MSDRKDGATGVPAPAADPVTTRLTELGVDASTIAKIKDDLGVTSVDDLACLTEADLVGVGMKKLPTRKLVAALKPAPTPSEASAGVMSHISFDDVLPSVPTDASWLEALKIGGVLKVDQSTVISAVRAALGHRVGLFNILDRIVSAMERFSEESEEQVDAEFFKLRKQMTRRSYADIFAAIDGFDGAYVTEARKKQLLRKIDEHLWPTIIEFYEQLKSWQAAWMQGAANPGMMMGAILAASGGGGVMPPGMMQPPDTGTLRDHADAVANAINKVFAGTGVQITAAIAYDASKIKEALANPRLPALTGAPNRDQMLRQLGVSSTHFFGHLFSMKSVVLMHGCYSFVILYRGHF